MNFELQPTLQGGLLKLRPLRESDFPSLFKVASDPLIWEQHPRKDRYKEDVFKEFFRGAMNSKGALLAIDEKTGETIGSSRYHNLMLEKGEVEVGYTFLARRCWGHTYNREMKELMLEHAWKFVPKVDFVIGENNLRSQRAVEKLGAHFVEKFHSHYPDGTSNGSVRYRLEKAEAARNK